ncbi:MAG: Phage capsid family protein [Clostridia bacterium]|jgi:HK97 family phage major capsid protein|nr:Phage capsid family protein [Clostridia bacterium]
MKNILELRQQRAKLVAESRAILDKAEVEKRELTAEDETQYQRMDAEIDKLTKDIDKEEKLQARERELGEVEARTKRPADGKPDAENRDNPRGTEEYRAAFEKFLRNGSNSLSESEKRAMQVDSDTGGGYLLTPQQFVNEFLMGLDSEVVIRGLARKFTLTTAGSLGVPTLDVDLDDAEWTPELKTGAATEVSVGKRELKTHQLTKRALISNALIRKTGGKIETLVRERLQYKFGVSEEKAFMTGDGNEKPLGLFTASDKGIGTARDIATGSATGFTGDGLIDARYSIKEGYIKDPSTRWLFHRDAIKLIRKLKNAVDGQYIWQPGITGGAPDRILEIPYITSDFCPNTFTNGLYAGILGCFKYYWIADALDMQIQRLVELYAETNQTGFIGRAEVDGMPVLAEAFTRVKCG